MPSSRPTSENIITTTRFDVQFLLGFSIFCVKKNKQTEAKHQKKKTTRKYHFAFYVDVFFKKMILFK